MDTRKRMGAGLLTLVKKEQALNDSSTSDLRKKLANRRAQYSLINQINKELKSERKADETVIPCKGSR